MKRNRPFWSSPGCFLDAGCGSPGPLAPPTSTTFETLHLFQAYCHLPDPMGRDGAEPRHTGRVISVVDNVAVLLCQWAHSQCLEAPENPHHSSHTGTSSRTLHCKGLSWPALQPCSRARSSVHLDQMMSAPFWC